MFWKVGARKFALMLSAIALPVFAQEPAQNAVPAHSPSAVKVDSDTISGLEARNIGPAVMSGRIAAMDAAIEKGRLTIYVGAATGGVWKSFNGGTTFKPVFDKQPVQAIGAVTIDPRNPRTVWVGTGESWVRNSVSVGDGVYKSTDGGDNWTNVGLKDSERIAKILVDPTTPDTVYVCATGHLWNANAERGVYKTTDGGKTWAQVLAVNNDTGCASLAMDPQSPGTLYAGMWQFRRTAWDFKSGGAGSAMFKTTDGGAHWNKLTKGLPQSEMGRIAVAVSPADPKVVYAFVEAQKGTGMYRSNDAGETWTAGYAGASLIWRPFYFANLFLDPKNVDRVYKPGLQLTISEDGAKTFSSIAGSVHSDIHAMWINPNNPDQLFVGNDGGLYASEDRGASWRFMANLPVAQFYHVSYDMQTPYNVYGGLQDNSSWMGPSNNAGGIANKNWTNLYGGDGFWTWEDPSDPDYAYAEAQGGEIGRINKKTHEERDVKPYPNAGEKKFRNNWNTPIQVSPNDKNTLYYGTQFLFRTRDHGQSWQRISPDLTTNDPLKQKQEESGGVTIDNSAAEMNTTIYTISESPKNASIVWVGTDDGNLQVTRDGAKSWTNVVKNVPGLPANAWVSTVEASRFDQNTAYVTFDNHTAGDLKTYVFKTGDLGKTWQPLVTPEITGYAHVVKEDTVDPNLLFVGTEHGLFISLDGGKQWAQFKGGNMPNVAVRDIAIHPRDNDVILATHGRGIWIIDDITPLRSLTPEVLSADAAFLPARNAVQSIEGSDSWFSGDSDFVGRSRPDMAFITYYQKKRHIFGDLKFEIFDPKGDLVSTLAGNKRRGLSRIQWSMRMKAPRVPPAASAAFAAAEGPRMVPGTYTVKMTKGKETYTTKFDVIQDPRAKHTAEDRRQQFDLAMKLYAILGRMTFAVDQITDVRNQANDRASKLPANDAARKQIETFGKNVDTLRGKIVATKEGGAITGEERIREDMAGLYGNVNGYEGKPTESQIERAGALDKDLSEVIAQFETLTKKDLAAVNSSLQKKNLQPITVISKADWDKKNSSSDNTGAASSSTTEVEHLFRGERD